MKLQVRFWTYSVLIGATMLLAACGSDGEFL